MTRKLRSHRHPSLEDLPEELILDILSRLPETTLIYCKCLCKRLRNLVYEIRLPKCLLINQYDYVGTRSITGVMKLVEIEEEHGKNNLLRDPFMCIDMTKLFPGSITFLAGSVDGLVCLWEITDECDRTYICNPMTREYMIIPKQKNVERFINVKYGFGVSLAGEYKVIRIVKGYPIKVEVYILGSHQWRNLQNSDVPCEVNSPNFCDHGLYLNGHIYWMLDYELLSFNLDKEKFQLFRLPRPPQTIIHQAHTCLGILKGCLCHLYNSDKAIVLWVMTKEQKMKKHWHKELEIAKSTSEKLYPKRVIDGSNNQSILLVQDKENNQLVACCLETNKFEHTTLSEIMFQIYNYRPSFLKLRNFQSSAKIHVF